MTKRNTLLVKKMKAVKLKTWIIYLLTLLITISLYPQNNKIEWSTFSSGSNYSKDSNSEMIIEMGQNFVGEIETGNTKIISGFLSNDFFNLTNVNENKQSIPTKFELSQNFPNPFNPSTTINYSLPFASIVNLEVFNILGEKIASLVNGFQQPGNYHVLWNAGNCASGIYLYRISTKDLVQTKKMILLK